MCVAPCAPACRRGCPSGDRAKCTLARATVSRQSSMAEPFRVRTSVSSAEVAPASSRSGGNESSTPLIQARAINAASPRHAAKGQAVPEAAAVAGRASGVASFQMRARRWSVQAAYASATCRARPRRAARRARRRCRRRQLQRRVRSVSLLQRQSGAGPEGVRGGTDQCRSRGKLAESSGNTREAVLLVLMGYS